jgi:RNA polymerase sigma factor (sigma-70 family)
VLEISVARDPSATTPWDPGSHVGDIDLRTALASMSPDDRALIALRYVAGFDSTELAHALHMSPSGTRARLARLLGRLRSELSDE